MLLRFPEAHWDVGLLGQHVGLGEHCLCPDGEKNSWGMSSMSYKLPPSITSFQSVIVRFLPQQSSALFCVTLVPLD